MVIFLSASSSIAILASVLIDSAFSFNCLIPNALLLPTSSRFWHQSSASSILSSSFSIWRVLLLTVSCISCVTSSAASLAPSIYFRALSSCIFAVSLDVVASIAFDTASLAALAALFSAVCAFCAFFNAFAEYFCAESFAISACLADSAACVADSVAPSCAVCAVCAADVALLEAVFIFGIYVSSNIFLNSAMNS